MDPKRLLYIFIAFTFPLMLLPFCTPTIKPRPPQQAAQPPIQAGSTANPEQTATEPQPIPLDTASSTPDPAQPSEAPTAEPNPLLQAIANKTPDEMMQAWGKPEAVLEDNGLVSWYYKSATVGPEGTTYPEVQFTDGRVSAVVSWPTDVMEDKIKTAFLNDGKMPPVKTRDKTFVFSEFYALTTGRTKQEILQALNEPDERSISAGHEVWQYRNIVYDSGTTLSMAIEFDGDRAAQIKSR